MMSCNLGYFNKYMREYCLTMRENIAQRNFISNEYYRNKILMNDKKTQKLQSGEHIELDQELMGLNSFTSEQVTSNREITRRFIFTNVVLEGNFEIACFW